ncbi:hypothetical protein N9B38_00330 [bacterium]|nr:hypothetical protein [bacterium]
MASNKKVYFIKRGEAVAGPFSASQIRGFVKMKKLKASDQISDTASGPFKKISPSQSEVKQDATLADVKVVPINKKDHAPQINRPPTTNPSGGNFTATFVITLAVGAIIMVGCGGLIAVVGLAASLGLKSYNAQQEADAWGERARYIREGPKK